MTKLRKAFGLAAWKSWTCQRCGFVYLSRADMHRHLKQHSTEGDHPGPWHKLCR